MKLYDRNYPVFMRLSIPGADNVEHWEGRSKKAYPDSVGKWTIGIGHLIVPGDNLNAHSVISDATVDALFANDIDEAENIIKQYVKVPLTQSMFNALADFTFQFGTKLGRASDGQASTLLKLLNQRDYVGAANQFKRWINIHNSVGQLIPVPQLVQRRAAATAMFRRHMTEFRGVNNGG